MEQLRRAAYLSIGRACGFAGLGVFCVMVGLSFDPLMAARSGGVLTTMITVVLIFKSRSALYQDYRKTEAWLILDAEDAPPEAYARWASATVLRDAYLWFAQYAAACSVVLWAVATILMIFRGSAD